MERWIAARQFLLARGSARRMHPNRWTPRCPRKFLVLAPRLPGLWIVRHSSRFARLLPSALARLAEMRFRSSAGASLRWGELRETQRLEALIRSIPLPEREPATRRLARETRVPGRAPIL